MRKASAAVSITLLILAPPSPKLSYLTFLSYAESSTYSPLGLMFTAPKVKRLDTVMATATNTARIICERVEKPSADLIQRTASKATAVRSTSPAITR